MRYELADQEWAAIKPMLPNKPRSRARVDDRRVLNGILGPAIRRTVARSIAGVGPCAARTNTCIARSKGQSMGRSRGGLTSKIHAVVYLQ